MKFKQYKFDNKADADFVKTLRSRVNAYFTENQKSRHGNISIYIKTVVMYALYITPFVLMLTGILTSLWVLFPFWIIMAIGMTGIGTCVVHDALHGTYSKNKHVNKFVGLTMNLVGSSDYVWKMQHNVLHHSFTNIAHADDDIEAPFVLRFSPHQKRLKIHRFQHVYVWFFYGLLMLNWITVKDFKQLFVYKSRGIIKSNKEFAIRFLKVASWKALYYGVFLVLPLIFIPASPLMVVLMFISMHFVTGFLLSVIFQSAHVLPETNFVNQEEEQIEDNWAVHQLKTTCNFAPKNKLLSWYIGGLNFQVEHHLFPNISHVHYNKLAPIIEKTANEFGVTYNTVPSFRKVVKEHVKWLKTLGKRDDAMLAYATSRN